MFEQIHWIRQKMTPEDLQQLEKIYAPMEVATPPSDATNGLCVTPPG